MTIARVVNMRRLSVALLLLAVGFSAYWFLLPGSSDAPPGIDPARIVQASDGLTYGVRKGDLARDFEASSLGGERFRLSDLHGSPVALKFWATWCSSCLKEFEIFKELRPRYENDGLRVLALNTGEPYKDALEFAEFLDQPFDWALDPTLTVADAYKVVGFPVSMFIDRDGVIQGVHVGEMNRDDIVRFIDGAVSAAPVPDGPRKLRLITTLPREHVLYVDGSGTPGVVVLRSKSLRCDDTYCADLMGARLAAREGVTGSSFDRSIDPPSLSVTFDPARTRSDAVVDAARDALEGLDDPLYQGTVEVRHDNIGGNSR